jgi:hypothetical protein
MRSEQQSKNTSSHPKVAERSPIVGVEVVHNRTGWHINVSLNQQPWQHFGPYEEKLTLPQAMQFVATTIQLEGL